MSNIPLCICSISLFIHSSADWHSGCFHALAMVNSAAMNTGEHMSFNSGFLNTMYFNVLPYLYVLIPLFTSLNSKVYHTLNTYIILWLCILLTSQNLNPAKPNFNYFSPVPKQQYSTRKKSREPPWLVSLKFTTRDTKWALSIAQL